MKNVTRLVLILSLLIATAGFLAGCESAQQSSLDEDMVREYADVATETCLRGLSNHDLDGYTQHANDEFKAAVTQDMLDATAAQIEKQLGAYQSIEFLRAEEQEDYVIVHYRATYARGEVGVRMVFDQDNLIAGQWFE